MLAPLFSNGGITSWVKKYLKTFPTDEFHLIPVSSVLGDKDMAAKLLKRSVIGLIELYVIKREMKRVFNKYPINIVHITTSGSLGTVRDFLVAKFCKKMNIKTIMHCHYGCISQSLEMSRGIRWILLKTMKLYDQIWVLDQYTYKTLVGIDELKNKVYLTPNSIEVVPLSFIPKKEYRNIAFIGNVLTEKGIFELVEAIVNVNKDIYLHIVGPCSNRNLERLEKMSGILWDTKIIYHGLLSNDEAIRFMKQIDTLILPTYYPQEAFPISILEAMSNGKLVISTPRAAIPDMLTALDGGCCGMLVEERNVINLRNAILYSLEHTEEMDDLCRKAYEKAWNAYRTDVVYNMYRERYRELLKE